MNTCMTIYNKSFTVHELLIKRFHYKLIKSDKVFNQPTHKQNHYISKQSKYALLLN